MKACLAMLNCHPTGAGARCAAEGARPRWTGFDVPLIEDDVYAELHLHTDPPLGSVRRWIRPRG